MKDLDEFYRNLNKSISQIHAVAREVEKFRISIQPTILKAVNESLKIRQRILDSLNTSDFFEAIGRIAEGAKATEEDLKIFKSAMVDLGYPPHNELDIRLMRNIAQDYKEKGKEYVGEYIDVFMINYYHPQFLRDQILYKWEKYEFLKKRIPLLRNVINAHNLQMYNLVVPSLISQFEGVIVDCFGIKGVVNSGIQRILFDTLLIKEGLSGFHFDDQIHNFYSKKVLVGFAHGEKIKSDISRHAILHGGDTEFGNENTSLKIILLFDFIVDAINEIDDQRVELGRNKVANYRLKSNKRKPVKKVPKKKFN